MTQTPPSQRRRRQPRQTTLEPPPSFNLPNVNNAISPLISLQSLNLWDDAT